MASLPPDTRSTGQPNPAGNVSLNSHKATNLANGSSAQDAVAFGQVLTLVATTGGTGTPYTLINGTGNIITWTAPSDGNMHRVLILGQVKVTSAQTGGAVVLAFTYPDASASPTATVNGGGAGTGYHGFTNSVFLVAPGAAVTLQQSTAQTVGAAVLWAEFWAS